MKRVLNHVAVVWRQNLWKPNYEACLSTQGKGLKDTRKSYEEMNATKIVFPEVTTNLRRNFVLYFRGITDVHAPTIHSQRPY